MKPNELDVEVAEKLFGYRSVDIYHVPCSSQDIGLAMQVHEKMTAMGLWLTLRSPWTPESDSYWYAGYTPMGVTGWSGRPDLEAKGSSASEAICRVALLVIDYKPIRDLGMSMLECYQPRSEADVKISVDKNPNRPEN